MNHHTPQHHLTIDSLWQFSLQYYSIPEVKEACLNLQNHFHGNVNLLLALKWLDEHGFAFSSQQWPLLIQSLGHTETALVHFRKLRRKMKQHLPEPLYGESLQFERQLERQQQADIVAFLQQCKLNSVPAPHLTDDYCQQLGAEHLAVIFNKQAL
ncbi:TIGR02444 family protein [Vibrio rarus]|uniref:TIGR02444 family protein n=1 Tax=Vibrio rarus TaxID=413403 RepID=UPI0021C403A3|nr:TIGR02444 family protein [Vibrio rarus]